MTAAQKKAAEKKAEEVKAKEAEEVKAKEAEEAEEAKAKEAEEVKAKEDEKDVKYMSKKLNLYHPYQKVRFMPGVPTACPFDSWLESQVNAGLIEKC